MVFFKDLPGETRKMTKETIKQKILNWLGELWGQDEIMMQRMPDKDLKFGLGGKKE